jgi:hypothetical protein
MISTNYWGSTSGPSSWWNQPRNKEAGHQRCPTVLSTEAVWPGIVRYLSLYSNSLLKFCRLDPCRDRGTLVSRVVGQKLVSFANISPSCVDSHSPPRPHIRFIKYPYPKSSHCDAASSSYAKFSSGELVCRLLPQQPFALPLPPPAPGNYPSSTPSLVVANPWADHHIKNDAGSFYRKILNERARIHAVFYRKTSVLFFENFSWCFACAKCSW